MDPTTLMMLATAILILTPTVRVAVSICAFAVDRDYTLVFVTSIVALVMIATVVLAHAGLS